MGIKPLEAIRCSGSFYQMGYAQGVWLRPRFEALFGTLLDNPLVPGWLSALGPHCLRLLLTIKGVSVRQHHLPNMEKMAPSQVSRLQGIADGAGLTRVLLMGLGSIEAQAANFQFIMGCSSLGVSPHRSKFGEALLAYNHDFPTFLQGHLIIRHSHPTQGHASIQLTYPTLPGCIAGVNDAGVAITLNHAFSTEPFNHGVPPTFLVQEALDHCKTADEVVSMFEATTFSCGSMATVIDESGGLYALELSREHFGVRYPEAGISLTLNDYQLESMQAIEVPQEAVFDPKKFPDSFHGIHVHSTNWDRRERFSEILAAIPEFDPQALLGILTDHSGTEGGMGTICRHHETSDTIASAIIYPAQRVIEATRGQPCKNHFQKFRIEL